MSERGAITVQRVEDIAPTPQKALERIDAIRKKRGAYLVVEHCDTAMPADVLEYISTRPDAAQIASVAMLAATAAGAVGDTRTASGIMAINLAISLWRYRIESAANGNKRDVYEDGLDALRRNP